MEETFGIDNFNIISDDEYYYVFRALNNGDHSDIENGITSESGEIDRIRTDRERWEETNNRTARFSKDSELSLEEIWSHIKKNYSKETNCISLSSNANVTIDYGKGYNEEYIMVKIPKTGDKDTVLAGQYMLEELSKKLDEVIKTLPQDSEVLKIIEEIENCNSAERVKNVAERLFKRAKSEKSYKGKDTKLDKKLHTKGRFSRRQYFSEEQQEEYNKIIAKLTVLEWHKDIKSILPTTRDNLSLIGTIGMAFSSGELIHYKDIEKEEFTKVSKEMMDVISLVQQAKSNDSIDKVKCSELEREIIHYINNNESIEIEKKATNIEELSIEEVYELTGGKVEYEKAREAISFISKLGQSREQTLEYSLKMQEIFNQSGDFNEIIEYIRDNGFVIDSDIVTRENGLGVQIAESVSIGTDRDTRKIISVEEQRKIVEIILSLDSEKLHELSINGGANLYNDILKDVLEESEEKSENKYFAEAIIDSLDFSKIYKNAINDDRKQIKVEERELLVSKLEGVDCKRLYNAFKNAGVSHKNIGGYIINLIMDNGYKGYTLEELSRLENLDEIISTNRANKMLNNKIVPFRLDELLENRDDANAIEGTKIKLRDYQQETSDNLDNIYEDKRFAGVVIPTGGGKSFIAMSEMLKRKASNMLYFAPQTEILNQIQRHILKYIVGVQVLTPQEVEELDGKEPPEGKIYPEKINDYIGKVFPHLKMYCYQSLAEKDAETREKELREILANSNADFMIFDEAHRAGAETWEPLIQQLMEKNSEAKTLAITATPIRDVDKKDMMETLARFSGDYTKDELARGEYLAKEMYLVDAIQDRLVVEPKIVSFNYSLAYTDEYKEVQNMYKEEKDEEKKAKLKEILDEMDSIINDTSDIQEMIMNESDPEKRRQLEEQFAEIRKEAKTDNIAGIGEVIKANIVKKDGRYIVFIPHTPTGLTQKEHMEQEIEKVKEMLKDIDDKPEIGYLLSTSNKADNLEAISKFEDSNSEHLKLLFAIDKLNEGVHVDGINGEIMLRKIGEGSRILYMQQLGRVIFSLDPDNPIPEDELPIVFDVFNNYLTQNMNKEIYKKTPTSDLQRVQSIVNWIDKHGYFPDVNSEVLSEARKAIVLKKIKIKYAKYLEGINSDNLSQKEIYEIEQIMDLANSIELFEREIPDRVIPPGEKDLSEVELFKVTGSQKRFLDLFKEADKTTAKTRILNSSIRIRRVLGVLESLTDYGVDINNDTIPEGTTLGEVIDKLPEHIRSSLLEEIDVDLDYEIGEEYNVAKAAFVDNRRNMVYLDYDVKDLRRYGIFEDTDRKFFKDGIKVKILENNFIVAGKKELQGINIKTGTYYGEDGWPIKGDFNKDGIHRNGTSWDDEGWDVNGNHRDTGKPYDRRYFTKDGYWVDVKEDGSYEITDSRYNPEGWDVNSYNRYTHNKYDKDGFEEYALYNDRMLTRDGKFVIIDEKTGEATITDRVWDDDFFTLDGHWVDVKEDGSYEITDRMYNEEGWSLESIRYNRSEESDIYKIKYTTKIGNVAYRRSENEGYNSRGYDREDYKEDGTWRDTGKPYNMQHFTKEGYWVDEKEDGSYEITYSRYDSNGWDIEHYNQETHTEYDRYDFKYDKTFKDTRRIYNERMLTRDGKYVIVDEKTGKVTVTDRPYDDKQFTLEGYWVDVKEDGSYEVTDKKYTPDRWDINDNYVDINMKTGQDIFTGKPYDRQHFTKEGYWVDVKKDGSYEITDITDRSKFTSRGALIGYIDVNQETGETIKYTNKEVADFVNSGMSKRGYCKAHASIDTEGIALKRLNILITEEIAKNPEIKDILNEAYTRGPSIEKEVKPEIRQLTSEIRFEKMQLAQMQSKKASVQECNNKKRLINEKIDKLESLKLQVAEYEKANPESKESKKSEAKIGITSVKKDISDSKVTTSELDDLLDEIFGKDEEKSETKSQANPNGDKRGSGGMDK